MSVYSVYYAYNYDSTTARTPGQLVTAGDDTDSEPTEAGTSSPGLDNMPEIDEGEFYMLRSIV